MVRTTTRRQTGRKRRDGGGGGNKKELNKKGSTASRAAERTEPKTTPDQHNQVRTHGRAHLGADGHLVAGGHAEETVLDLVLDRNARLELQAGKSRGGHRKGARGEGIGNQDEINPSQDRPNNRACLQRWSYLVKAAGAGALDLKNRHAAPNYDESGGSGVYVAFNTIVSQPTTASNCSTHTHTHTHTHTPHTHK